MYDILPPSDNFETSKINNKENVDKQELIGDCLDFCLMYLLRYVDAILNKIGEGGFGSVYLCFNKNCNNLFAIKCIKSSF
jgi:serine/threonine protein kinase